MLFVELIIAMVLLSTSALLTFHLQAEVTYHQVNFLNTLHIHYAKR